jgi:hypothetical protein
MKGAPSIYGDLTPEAEAAYSRWIMALFDRTDHQAACRMCRDPIYFCTAGVILGKAERAAWAEWHAIRTAEAHRD